MSSQSPATQPTASVEKSQSRYGDLFDIATKLFSEHGYERTTVRMIADEMGVKSGSLYSHIKSKEEMLRLIVLACAEQLIDVVEEAKASTDVPEAQLRAICRAHMKVQQEERASVKIYFEEWQKLDAESRQRVVDLRGQYEQLLAGVIEAGIERGDFAAIDVRGAVLVLASSLNWAYTWYRPDGKLSPEEIADLFVTTLLNGLWRRTETPPGR